MFSLYRGADCDGERDHYLVVAELREKRRSLIRRCLIISRR